jgi:hypothetical protein
LLFNTTTDRVNSCRILLFCQDIMLTADRRARTGHWISALQHHVRFIPTGRLEKRTWIIAAMMSAPSRKPTIALQNLIGCFSSLNRG